jgi:threonine dehydrogenase-like Zn-dependent dehydrogenase
VPCRDCAHCAAGVFSSCEHSLGAYGYRPFPAPTQLLGGFAECLYLHPNSVVHRISRDVPVEIASMFNTLAAGVRWAVQLGGVQPGDTVAVLGAGQRGIAAAMAAKAAGAQTVIITGLTQDAHKLALARESGADQSIVADTENVPERIREITEGRLADVVLDLTPMAAQPVRDALDSARFGGTVVLAGLKGHRPIELITDRIIQKGLRILGAHGVESTSLEAAIQLMESGSYPLERLHTHSFDLDHVPEAISVLAGEVEGEHAVHVAILPR